MNYLQTVSLKYDIAIEQEKYIRYAYSNYNLKVIRAMSYFYEGLCYKYIHNIEKAKTYLSLAVQAHIEGAQDSLNTLLK